MEMAQIAAIGIISVILAIVVKKQSPEAALALSIASAVLIFILILPRISSVIEMARTIASGVGANQNYIEIIFKVVGISYIAEFASQICSDGGETAIAAKIDLAGRILIMTVSAPVLLALLDVVANLIPS
jgi:stage III sporulation protein AD